MLRVFAIPETGVTNPPRIYENYFSRINCRRIICTFKEQSLLYVNVRKIVVITLPYFIFKSFHVTKSLFFLFYRTMLELGTVVMLERLNAV